MQCWVWTPKAPRWSIGMTSGMFRPTYTILPGNCPCTWPIISRQGIPALQPYVDTPLVYVQLQGRECLGRLWLAKYNDTGSFLTVLLRWGSDWVPNMPELNPSEEEWRKKLCLGNLTYRQLGADSAHSTLLNWYFWVYCNNKTNTIAIKGY